MFRPALVVLLSVAACYAATGEPAPPSYRNPLDLVDGGTSPSDGGQAPDAGLSRSIGTVDGLMPNLFSATYFVEVDDAGVGRTSLFLSDVGGLCSALAGDAGLGDDWSLVRFRIEGDDPGTYPVAPILPPAGATAEFDYQSDAGGFGTTPASGGSLELDAIDPGDVQPTIGTYTLTFEGSDSLTGSFVATPCALVPPAPGG